MLLLIRQKPYRREPVYLIQIHLMLLLIPKVNANLQLLHYSNTSYVIINLAITNLTLLNVRNSNTSYVIINPFKNQLFMF